MSFDRNDVLEKKEVKKGKRSPKAKPGMKKKTLRASEDKDEDGERGRKPQADDAVALGTAAAE
jgi:hypothetical protein